MDKFKIIPFIKIFRRHYAIFYGQVQTPPVFHKF